jgi:hypothetical protein
VSLSSVNKKTSWTSLCFFGRKLFFLTLSYLIKKTLEIFHDHHRCFNHPPPPHPSSQTAVRPIIHHQLLHNHVRSELLKQTNNTSPHPYNLNPKMGSSNSTSLIFNFTLIFCFPVIISKIKLKTWNRNYSLFFHDTEIVERQSFL